MDLTKCLYLNPLDVHYTQDTISCRFSDGQSIGETLDKLVNMESFVTELPTIEVAKQDDKYYSRNNRRLWVFRQLAIMNKCEFIPVKENAKIPDVQFTTDVGGNEIVVRGDHCSVTLTEFKKKKRFEALKKIKARRLSISIRNVGVGKQAAPATPLSIGFSPRFKVAYDKFKLGDRNRRILRARRKLKERVFFGISPIKAPCSSDRENRKTAELPKSRWQPHPQRLVVPGRHATNFIAKKRQNKEKPSRKFNRQDGGFGRKKVKCYNAF